MGNLNSNIENNKLSCITEIKIRFCEVDSIKVVWHGNYVKYLEDGREDFGEKFGLQYLKIFENGFTAPVVDMRLQFKQSISVAESIIVETNYIPTKAAKIIFNYNIYKKSDHSLVLTAQTTQVFMDLEGNLQLSNPEFYEEWKKSWIKE
ncbi:MAG: acyl-CoA thioesterase [Paludibacteraceae bacterium]|nr:acyl-CoA thioesterase [Bacteroidales bacterium]MBQ9101018.1 acyl-CoA thioesterase [Paludibacteraceae bacterium]MBR6658986.1 acyl-CoA thioesterase [Paludibacteraceae bacterium]